MANGVFGFESWTQFFQFQKDCAVSLHLLHYQFKSSLIFNNKKSIKSPGSYIHISTALVNI